MLEPAGIVELSRRRGAVSLDIASSTLRLALTHVAEESGWYRCTHTDPARCECVHLTDRLVHDAPDQVVVVQDNPAECQAAVEAVIAGQARSVLLATEPETLDAVFAALDRDSILVPRRVAELAACAPRLNQRLRTTLKLVVAGRSNQAIARAQHQSISTTKRDITELFELFDVTNRAALTRAAGRLGFV